MMKAWNSGWLVVIGVVVLYAAVGCKSGPGGGGDAVAKPAAALNPDTLGAVGGVVRFAGKAPSPVKIDTSMDPACGFSGGGDVFSEQYAVKGDRLANVYVYVKSGPAAAMEGAQGSSASVVMDQKGCMYVPHVVAAQVGQPVDFHNDDVTMHNVHAVPAVAGNAPVDISQGPKGAPQVRTFKQPEAMMPVRCNNHPWMDAFINISATPFFAVTGPDGKFALKGMPAGEYVLGAVQEKMGEQEVKVTVRAKEQATADFTFAMK
jgi:plastocyanin